MQTMNAIKSNGRPHGSSRPEAEARDTAVLMLVSYALSNVSRNSTCIKRRNMTGRENQPKTAHGKELRTHEGPDR